MRNYRYYIFLFLVCLAFSCQEDMIQSEVPSQGIKVTKGRLHFPDENLFDKTLHDVQNGVAAIVDGRLSGLNYKSLLSTSPVKENDGEDFNLMGLAGYQVLLNDKHEVQIGDYVVVMSNLEKRIFDLNGELKGIVKNEVSYYDRSTKTFLSRENALGKTFNTWYSQFLGYQLPNYSNEVRYRWTRVRSGMLLDIKYDYYYESKYYRHFTETTPTTVYAIERSISDCSTCSQWPSNPYGGVKYSVSGVVYHCGTNTASNEVLNGAWLRAVYYIRFGPNPGDLIYNVYHQDDLDI